MQRALPFLPIPSSGLIVYSSAAIFHRLSYALALLVFSLLKTKFQKPYLPANP